MPCFSPIPAWKRQGGGVTFNRHARDAGMPIFLPCNGCVGCRLEYSRRWAMRCLHEAKLHSSNCYITLTYSNDFLPVGGTLVLKDFQQFMKRLRFNTGAKIRFFHCGEYGEKHGRPHYHALLFGFDFSDKLFVKNNFNGDKLYSSVLANKYWGKGECTLGDVTFKSAGYVARYIFKKINGDMAADHYAGRAPEYCTMSRRPGIGRAYFDKYMTDIYPSDFMVVNGVKCKPPRTYDNWFEEIDDVLLESVKWERECRVKLHADELTPDRLKVREELALLRLEQLKRNGVE